MPSVLIVVIIILVIVLYVTKARRTGGSNPPPPHRQTGQPGQNQTDPFKSDGTIAMDRGGFVLQQLNYITRQGKPVCGENGCLETKVAKSFRLNQDKRFEAEKPLRIVRSGSLSSPEDALFTDPHIVNGENITDYIGSNKFYIQKGLCEEETDDNQRALCPAIFIRTVSDLSDPDQDPILIMKGTDKVKTDTIVVPMGGKHCGETSYRLIDSDDNGYAQTSTFFLAYQPFRVVKTADYARAAELLRPIEVKN